MSGGSMEYAYQRIHDIQELLLISITEGGNHRDLRMRVAHHLSQCAMVVKAMEWADSCDTGPDEWVSAAEHLLANPPDEVIADATGKRPKKTRGHNPEADAQLIKRHIAALKRAAEELEASLQERTEETDGSGRER